MPVRSFRLRSNAQRGTKQKVYKRAFRWSTFPFPDSTPPLAHTRTKQNGRSQDHQHHHRYVSLAIRAPCPFGPSLLTHPASHLSTPSIGVPILRIRLGIHRRRCVDHSGLLPWYALRFVPGLESLSSVRRARAKKSVSSKYLLVSSIA